MYFVVIFSISGNGGKERMKLGYRNRMFEIGFEYLMYIFMKGLMLGVYNYGFVVNFFWLKFIRINKLFFGKRLFEKF